MPFFYRLIADGKDFSRWLERKITGGNTRGFFGSERVIHMMVNGTLIGGGACILFLIFVLTRQ